MLKKLLLLLFLIPSLAIADWFRWFEPSNFEECFDKSLKKAKNNQAVYIAREGCRRLFMNNKTDKAYGKCLLNLSKDMQTELAGHIGIRKCTQLHLREDK